MGRDFLGSEINKIFVIKDSNLKLIQAINSAKSHHLIP